MVKSDSDWQKNEKGIWVPPAAKQKSERVEPAFRISGFTPEEEHIDTSKTTGVDKMKFVAE